MKWLIQLSVIILSIYVIIIYMEWDRLVWLKLKPLEYFIEDYMQKPKWTKNRVVAVIPCKGRVSEITLKSILDQSIGLHDIAIQSNYPDFKFISANNIITFHKPGTEFIRETNANTIILHLKNGVIYRYDEIEQEILFAIQVKKLENEANKL